MPPESSITKRQWADLGQSLGETTTNQPVVLTSLPTFQRQATAV